MNDCIALILYARECRRVAVKLRGRSEQKLLQGTPDLGSPLLNCPFLNENIFPDEYKSLRLQNFEIYSSAAQEKHFPSLYEAFHFEIKLTSSADNRCRV
jgi:hypothetical protein